MVKNGERRSLRATQSSFSLRTTSSEQAAHQRINELESQLAALSSAHSSSPRNGTGSNATRDSADLISPSATDSDTLYSNFFGPRGSDATGQTLPEGPVAINAPETYYKLQRGSTIRDSKYIGNEQAAADGLGSAGRSRISATAKSPARTLFDDFLRRGNDTAEQLPHEGSIKGSTSEKRSRAQQVLSDLDIERGNDKQTSTSKLHVANPSLISKAIGGNGGSHMLKSPEAYTQPFCSFLTENPTVWHAVDHFERKLTKAGFQKLSERKAWEKLERGGKYFVNRNGSSLIAFTIGEGYKSGNGVAMVAGHIDALTARLKPVSNKRTSAGYVQLGVAPYAGGLNQTWWDRDLGIGGRVLVKDEAGKISTKLVKLGWPIARIPTLAPHFGVGMFGQNNAETQAVPIIGLESVDPGSSDEFANITLGGVGSFAATQPPRLVRAIAGELSITDYSSIVNWELELYDTQPAQTGGLDKEFIFAGRIDDKLCSWSALEGLLSSATSPTASAADDGIIKMVGLFDDEEIGSLLRQGARGNFMPSVVERVTESLSSSNASNKNVLAQTYANSFLVSADVTHAVNPNFLSSYLEGHAPRLNTGLVIAADSNGHMTSDSVSSALLTRVAEKSDSKLQVFQIRNDSRSGGTVGPMLSSAMGVRAVDAGLPQLSMHSIRATTGALDPGLGVKIFRGFFDHFESIDKEFED